MISLFAARHHVLALECADSLPLAPEELAANKVPEFELSELQPSSAKGAKDAEKLPPLLTPALGQLRVTPTSTPLRPGGDPYPRAHLDIVSSASTTPPPEFNLFVAEYLPG